MKQRTARPHIAELRRQRSLSQKALADLVGVHESKIGHIETGFHQLSGALVVKLANALGVSVEEILAAEIDLVTEQETAEVA
jgi:transcriptional regulator with XRE-family HTH domain